MFIMLVWFEGQFHEGRYVKLRASFAHLLEAVLKIREEGWMQGARNAETGMYKEYMRISSTAQRRRRPPQQFLGSFLEG